MLTPTPKHPHEHLAPRAHLSTGLLALSAALLMSSALGGCIKGDPLPYIDADAALTWKGRCEGMDNGVECARKRVCIDQECVPALCGDGFKTGAEECDDGNVVRDDGCSDECVLVTCGNGKVEGYESCDDGNTDDGDRCPGSCTGAACGNGKVEEGETCDGPEVVVGDAGSSYSCREDCMQKTASACETCAREKCVGDEEADAGALADAGSGPFNYVEGCLTSVHSSVKTPGDDFLQRCADVVNCSLRTGCGLKGVDSSNNQPELPCYCGEQTLEQCQSKGSTADAPCADVWKTAADAENNKEMFERFTDTAYPVGWARPLIACFAEKCADVCVPK